MRRALKGASLARARLQPRTGPAGAAAPAPGSYREPERTSSLGRRVRCWTIVGAIAALATVGIAFGAGTADAVYNQQGLVRGWVGWNVTHGYGACLQTYDGGHVKCIYHDFVTGQGNYPWPLVALTSPNVPYGGYYIAPANYLFWTSTYGAPHGGYSLCVQEYPSYHTYPAWACQGIYEPNDDGYISGGAP